ncbi:atp-dependent helicase/deoxyribonuclease subunit b [Anaeramoeba flamelloides]|uniref:Atp-dependent helicase/deoxyribonuclease subunit b n=1 Tax=Anaeramoeba flamelloides TaxID=1746091 RepID=A0ABQ8YCJ7_9EUKA|nr:atp-dependent helicase/deoxyribonuclease subunit b [Anaeramoeba flamelloides]
MLKFLPLLLILLSVAQCKIKKRSSVQVLSRSKLGSIQTHYTQTLLKHSPKVGIDSECVFPIRTFKTDLEPIQTNILKISFAFDQRRFETGWVSFVNPQKGQLLSTLQIILNYSEKRIEEIQFVPEYSPVKYDKKGKIKIPYGVSVKYTWNKEPRSSHKKTMIFLLSTGFVSTLISLASVIPDFVKHMNPKSIVNTKLFTKHHKESN